MWCLITDMAALPTVVQPGNTVARCQSRVPCVLGLYVSVVYDAAPFIVTAHQHPPPHAALLGPAKLFHIDQDGMVDRAYRLHYNESQRRTDLFAAVSHFNTLQ